jgi:hypothetical protein
LISKIGIEKKIELIRGLVGKKIELIKGLLGMFPKK